MPVALVGVIPNGSVSFTVTRPPVAPKVLTFVSDNVYDAADPRVKFVPT